MQKYYTYGDRPLMRWLNKPRAIASCSKAIPKNWIAKYIDASGHLHRIAASTPQAVYTQLEKRMKKQGCKRLQVLARYGAELVKVDCKRFFALCNER